MGRYVRTCQIKPTMYRVSSLKHKMFFSKSVKFCEEDGGHECNVFCVFRMGQIRPLFVYFCYFQMTISTNLTITDKSIDGVLET